MPHDLARALEPPPYRRDAATPVPPEPHARRAAGALHDERA
jgi:hypothetical protein